MCWGLHGHAADQSPQEEGVKAEYGLSERGHQQALKAGCGHTLQTFRKTYPPPRTHTHNRQDLASNLGSPLVVLASPFSRTMQTAEGALQGMGIQLPILPEPALAERYFGSQLELQGDDMYPLVWRQDAQDPECVPGGDGESVAAVSRRMAALMQRLDESYRCTTILLVGHCDTLAILEATVRKTPLADFRRYALKNCEFRPL